MDIESIKADSDDRGYQDKIWIMAPSGNDPNGNPCSNEMKFKISFDPSVEMEIFYPEGDPAPATPTPATLTLDSTAVECAWHGESSSTTETPAVTWEIGSPDQTKHAVALPIAVKTMKRRTVKLRIYQSVKKEADGTQLVADPNLIPSKSELENFLNSLFAYQLNTWFDVSFEPDIQAVDWGDDFDYYLSSIEHTPDQNNVMRAHLGEFGSLALDNNNYDVHLFLIGNGAPFLREGGEKSAVGVAVPVYNTGVGGTEPSRTIQLTTKQSIRETVGHEIGHIFFDAGHPDNPASDQRGVAPLVGTDHTKRLMYSANNADSRLIVKAEWDKAEEWLKERARGDQ